MKNFSTFSSNNDARTELHNAMNLTGCEISVNTLPAGACVPFVHFHKNNEEVYFVFSGSGYVEIDGEKIELRKGDFVRISPQAKRQFFASDNCKISFICIQTKENSLQGFTADDAVLVQ